MTVRVLLLLSLCIITGCASSGEFRSTADIIAEEVLTLDPDADIFRFDDVIYQTNIDWVDELTLTKDVQIGEIKTKNNTNTDFENEMANKLPVGAKIFSAKERNDILLVEINGDILKYLAIVEG